MAAIFAVVALLCVVVTRLTAPEELDVEETAARVERLRGLQFAEVPMIVRVSQKRASEGERQPGARQAPAGEQRAGPAPPEVHLGRGKAVPEPRVRLGDGWKRVDTDVWGEWRTAALVGAERAGAWGGDRYELWQRGSERTLVMRWVADACGPRKASHEACIRATSRPARVRESGRRERR